MVSLNSRDRSAARFEWSAEAKPGRFAQPVGAAKEFVPLVWASARRPCIVERKPSKGRAILAVPDWRIMGGQDPAPGQWPE